MAALRDVIRRTQDALDAAGIDDARLEAEVMLINVLQMPRHRIYAYQEQELTPRQEELLAQLVERRLKREPLAYMLGHKEFYGLDLAVGRGVLIPRPETELLVEQTLFLAMMHMEAGELVIAEPGTGSGAVSINLAIHLPMARIYATELYPEALKVAEYNIGRHNVADRVTLLQGDLLDPVDEAGGRYRGQPALCAHGRNPKLAAGDTVGAARKPRRRPGRHGHHTPSLAPGPG